MTETHPLIETWGILTRVTRLLLEAIPSEALADKLETRGWSVGKHFAHLHAVRLMWLEGYPALTTGLSKVPTEQIEDKAVLLAALDTSAQTVSAMLEQAIAADKVKNFKRPPAAFVGYLVAHESYHHGEIGVILAQSGHRLPKDAAWGMWEWDKL